MENNQGMSIRLKLYIKLSSIVSIFRYNTRLMINHLKTSDLVFIKKILTFLLGTLPYLSFAYTANVQSDQEVLKVGVVPQFEQRHLFRSWQPILFELEKITALKFELVGSPKIPVFEKEFNKGAYDIAYMNPYHVLKAYKAQGYLPLVRDNKKLNGILVVNNGSSIRTVSQLMNKVIAFPAPNALGASLLMRSILTEKFGLMFTSKYVQTHSSVYLHVAKGVVDAGGGVDRTFYRQADVLKRNLRIIYETPEIVSHPIVIHPCISASKRHLIKNGLIALFKTTKGKRLFSNIPIDDLVTTTIDDYMSLEKYNLEKYFER